MFQSTPPRGGRLCSLTKHSAGLKVSIHAPARGATFSQASIRSIISGFNPRPRAGGDVMPSNTKDKRTCFNPRPRARGDIERLLRKRFQTRFQSTPPRGRRRAGIWCKTVGLSFNPRPRAGGDKPARNRGDRRDCFNPRPRAGGDVPPRRNIAFPARVSIHAPARGATFRGWSKKMKPQVSIHAPARGATAQTHRSNPDPDGFNPRPRAGGDLHGEPPAVVLAMFQSTPPRAGRPCLPPTVCYSKKFQSTPPRGRRRINVSRAVKAAMFQSTPPRGGRLPNSPNSRPWRRVSIHAPARGATMMSLTNLSGSMAFQSTPPRGGRHAAVMCRLHYRRVSIHAPARGATSSGGASAVSHQCFNPRPRAGGDPFWVRFLLIWGQFQSTPPRGGRPGRRGQGLSNPGVSIHAPARGATKVRENRMILQLFQSTPPRGGRPPNVRKPRGFSSGFNPRPRAGGDHARQGKYTASRVSIHAPARGATGGGGDDFGGREEFQSTPPRGGRHPTNATPDHHRGVSIHAPARGATSGLHF